MSYLYEDSSSRGGNGWNSDPHREAHYRLNVAMFGLNGEPGLMERHREHEDRLRQIEEARRDDRQKISGIVTGAKWAGLTIVVLAAIAGSETAAKLIAKMM